MPSINVEHDGQRQAGLGGRRAAHAADPLPAREPRASPARISAATRPIAAPARSMSTAGRSSPARCSRSRPQGADVLTIEGMAGADGKLHALQEGFPRDARAPVRLLHAGHDHARPSPAAGEPEPDRGRNPASAFPATSAAAPATRTSSRRSNTPPPSSTAWNSGKPRNERSDRPLLASSAPKNCRAWAASASASRTCASRKGKRQLRRRHQAARHAARRFPSLEPRPCADQVKIDTSKAKACRASSRC